MHLFKKLIAVAVVIFAATNLAEAFKPKSKMPTRSRWDRRNDQLAVQAAAAAIPSSSAYTTSDKDEKKASDSVAQTSSNNSNAAKLIIQRIDVEDKEEADLRFTGTMSRKNLAALVKQLIQQFAGKLKIDPPQIEFDHEQCEITIKDAPKLAEPVICIGFHKNSFIFDTNTTVDDVKFFLARSLSELDYETNPASYTSASNIIETLILDLATHGLAVASIAKILHILYQIKDNIFSYGLGYSSPWFHFLKYCLLGLLCECGSHERAHIFIKNEHLFVTHLAAGLTSSHTALEALRKKAAHKQKIKSTMLNLTPNRFKESIYAKAQKASMDFWRNRSEPTLEEEMRIVQTKTNPRQCSKTNFFVLSCCVLLSTLMLLEMWTLQSFG